MFDRSYMVPLNPSQWNGIEIDRQLFLSIRTA